jgi:hypothetical protein
MRRRFSYKKNRHGSCANLKSDENDRPDDDGLLLRLYVQHEPVLWHHEEIAHLAVFLSDLTLTHRQKTNWQVGFLFFCNILRLWFCHRAQGRKTK